jgi:tetratricopeptide (TPR) repeat protein
MDIELEPQVDERIQALCEEGDQLADEELYPEAREKYIEALKLLPDPKNNWEASTWIYVAIGDTYFFSDNFRKMLDYFENAVQCPGGLGNPFIHLRLGQAYFEQKNLEKSADELTRAYMGADIDIFVDDDPKYLAFLETKIEM